MQNNTATESYKMGEVFQNIIGYLVFWVQLEKAFTTSLINLTTVSLKNLYWTITLWIYIILDAIDNILKIV